MDKLQQILNAYADKGYAEVKANGISDIFDGKTVMVDDFVYSNNTLCVCLANRDYDMHENIIPVRCITEVL